MKHIVIDARLYGPKHTGIGRYTKNLLAAMLTLPEFTKYKFTILIYPDQKTEVLNDLGHNFDIVTTTIKHYSLGEQLFLPFLLYQLKPNLVHFTHFNKPLLYFGKSVVTIHDLIKHFFTGKDTTTRTAWSYWPKYLIYRLSTYITIKTNTIIVPSNFWKNYLLSNFNVPARKITTTHEAVDPKFLSYSQKPKSPHTKTPYIIYTGNLYPHKNVTVILKALTNLPEIKLKIISGRNVFVDKFKKSINPKLKNQVEFLGYIDDNQFENIYSQALALVHPSFMEGFSLTGLEAMAFNCPVISSNTSCLPEIYGDSVLYFDPHNADQLSQQITTLQNNNQLRLSLINKGREQLSKYSWLKTARTTLKVYQRSL